ncbi:hypothetical protein GQ54DRAFT_125155 [Martensiomyces pterosporus]|nr:hypothetical protein GQ54DRAFT_125155 [Martensiomyces pterosporus]
MCECECKRRCYSSHRLLEWCLSSQPGHTNGKCRPLAVLLRVGGGQGTSPLLLAQCMTLLPMYMICLPGWLPLARKAVQCGMGIEAVCVIQAPFFRPLAQRFSRRCTVAKPGSLPSPKGNKRAALSLPCSRPPRRRSL